MMNGVEHSSCVNVLPVWGVSPNVVLYKDAAQVSQETGSFTFEHTAALDHLFIC